MNKSNKRKKNQKTKGPDIVIKRDATAPGKGYSYCPGLKGFGKPGDWRKGLWGTSMYVWLVDCYRMRVDDIYIYQERPNGVYLDYANKFTVTTHFWMFCRLAVNHDIVDSKLKWDWKEFLDVAFPLIVQPFMKADAKKKYGDENVYLVESGHRSLRHTGTLVYDSEITSTVRPRENFMDVFGVLDFTPPKSADSFTTELELFVEELTSKEEFWTKAEFKDVGSKEIWKDFCEKIKVVPFKIIPKCDRELGTNIVVSPQYAK